MKIRQQTIIDLKDQGSVQPESYRVLAAKNTFFIISAMFGLFLLAWVVKSLNTEARVIALVLLTAHALHLSNFFVRLVEYWLVTKGLIDRAKISTAGVESNNLKLDVIVFTQEQDKDHHLVVTLSSLSSNESIGNVWVVGPSLDSELEKFCVSLDRVNRLVAKEDSVECFLKKSVQNSFADSFLIIRSGDLVSPKLNIENISYCSKSDNQVVVLAKSMYNSRAFEHTKDFYQKSNKFVLNETERHYERYAQESVQTMIHGESGFIARRSAVLDWIDHRDNQGPLSFDLFSGYTFFSNHSVRYVDETYLFGMAGNGYVHFHQGFVEYYHSLQMKLRKYLSCFWRISFLKNLLLWVETWKALYSFRFVLFALLPVLIFVSKQPPLLGSVTQYCSFVLLYLAMTEASVCLMRRGNCSRLIEGLFDLVRLFSISRTILFFPSLNNKDLKGSKRNPKRLLSKNIERFSFWKETSFACMLWLVSMVFQFFALFIIGASNQVSLQYANFVLPMVVFGGWVHFRYLRAIMFIYQKTNINIMRRRSYRYKVEDSILFNNISAKLVSFSVHGVKIQLEYDYRSEVKDRISNNYLEFKIVTKSGNQKLVRLDVILEYCHLDKDRSSIGLAFRQGQIDKISEVFASYFKNTFDYYEPKKTADQVVAQSAA